MEGNRRSLFKKQSNPQFKKKGSSKKGFRPNSGPDQSESSSSSDTVYRILCQSRKIGSVLGKGGNIVKALREETRSKITVADSVPGSDERMIIIYSPSTRVNKKGGSDEDQGVNTKNELDRFDPHCAAQDALLKVHDRIIEEDIRGGVENDNVTARLLVPNNTVGCLLGKKGDVIQRLRSDTGANIRVLSAEHLPTCAMSTDELVQISGKPAVVKRALYEVSTLLHQNPKKDVPPLGPGMPYGAQGYHPPSHPVLDFSATANPMWSRRPPDFRDSPSMSWMEEYRYQHPQGAVGGFDAGPPPVNEEAGPIEFSMKILCSAGKIGGVIGKGGINVRHLEEETGAGIHVLDASSVSEERVIRVSSVEASWDPRSQTIEAILQLQDKTSEISDKGNITTRLLFPSNKVGCILGQGGHVINEMRRRTQADIRVFTKEDKPKCAGSDEELVQISGKFAVAKDALAEIASRLRTRVFRDADDGVEQIPARAVRGFGPSGSVHADGSYSSDPMRAGYSSVYGVEQQIPGPVRGFGPSGYLHADGPYSSDPMRVGHPSAYELVKGDRRDYGPRSYPLYPSDMGYANDGGAMEKRMAIDPMDSVIGEIDRYRRKYIGAAGGSYTTEF